LVQRHPRYFANPSYEHESRLFRRPGLGFEIDKRRLRKYAKRFFKLTEIGLKLRVIREKGIKAALEVKKRKQAQR
jgi:hypothetical protein